MVLVSSGKPNIHLRCAAASELLDELSTIPIEFFYAMNTVSVGFSPVLASHLLTMPDSYITWPTLATC
jgi:hypothetical protein